MKDIAKRVERINEYAETAFKTETINLNLLPEDADALWEDRNQHAVVVCIDDAANTCAHISTMQTGPVPSQPHQDPNLKSVIQPQQAEADPTVQLVASWARRVEHWRDIHHDAACKAINKMFRAHEGRSAFRVQADDAEEALAETWAALLTWFMTGEVRTNPAPPRRPDGVSITKGVRIQNVLAQNVEKWIVKIAQSRADELARKRCPRDQKEEKRLRLLRHHPNGTPTFPQTIPTEESTRAAFGLEGPSSRDQEFFAGDQYAAWEGESNPDPRTAMSLRPGPLLIFGLVGGLSEIPYADGEVKNVKVKRNGPPNLLTENELLASVRDAWKFNASGTMPVRHVSEEEWKALMDHPPVTTFAGDKSYRHDHPIKSKPKRLRGFHETSETNQSFFGMGMSEPKEHGLSNLDNLLDPQVQASLKSLEKYGITSTGTASMYHREYKRVKLIRHLSDGLRTWVERGKQRILVDRCDLQTNPWPRPKAPKRPKNSTDIPLVA